MKDTTKLGRKNTQRQPSSDLAATEEDDKTIES